MMGSVHAMPRADLVEHVPNDGCACGPEVHPVPTADGSIDWAMMHHALDGRELEESA